MVYDSTLYDRSHYAWSAEHDWPHLVRAAAGVVALLGQPKSHLDVGCGCGAVTWFMGRFGRSIGLELYPGKLLADVEDIRKEIHDTQIRQADFREPFDLGEAFELVTCWEVAEHLPESAAETFVASCAAHVAPGGHLVWTAGQPGQDGTGHINCQPKEYWAGHFVAQGLEYLDQETRFLTAVWDHTVNPLLWLRDNVQVWRRPP